ncbi:MAG: MBL fold metallo-hydrolase [Lachnospiraceae bacterium]|nr:MBL fold metallo-hydrolase [Lachnospiraceae bacterium]
MTENIRVFTQNSICITGGGKKIYIDPFEMRESFNDADFVLVTHDHHDHFSPEDIAKVVGKETILVVPKDMEETAKEVKSLVKKTYTVIPEESYDIEGLSFETIPSYNMNKAFHPRSANWVGYILTVDGKRIFVAGDTDATPEAKTVKCDIALVPIGGTYTMDPSEAAALINEIKPEVAIPTHYGGIVGTQKDAEAFSKQVNPPVKVEIKIEF